MARSQPKGYTPRMADLAPKLATWDDLLGVEEGYLGEIVNGELVVTPRPGPPHTETASDLGIVLGGPFRLGRGGPGGWVIAFEPRVLFIEDIRVPDLAAWRVERYQRPERGPYTVVPDWVCEILSEDTAIEDRVEKLPLYARARVPFVWLIDPVGFSLEVYELSQGRYFLGQAASGKASLRVPPFDAIELELSLLWGDRYPKTEPGA
jgi:Uma2 family endonuclease